MSRPSINDKLNKLREIYASQLPEKIRQIEKDWVVLQGDPGNDEGTKELLRALHKLNGPAASFGFKEVSIAARELESELKAAIEKGCIDRDIMNVPVAMHIGKMLRRLFRQIGTRRS